MVQRIETVIAPLEEVAELNRLVGLVVMHGPDVQADETEGQGAGEGNEEEPAKGLA
jgi:hypothetical protein